MAILHTVNKSPFERNALTTCLRLAAKGSTILFIEDGVIAATKGSKFSQVVTGALGDYKFCFLNRYPILTKNLLLQIFLKIYPFL